MRFVNVYRATLPHDMRIERPLIFFADLHISDRSRGDDFAPHEKVFRQTLAALPDEAQIYFLGDTFDDIELSPIPGSGFVSQIKPAYLDLLDEINSRRATYVVGNHDLFLDMCPHLCPRVVRAGLEVARHGGILAEHGHEADPANRGSGWFGRAVSLVNGAAERLFGWQLDDAYAELRAEHAAWRDAFLAGATPSVMPPRKVNLDTYRDYAERRLTEAHADVFIFGHTHRMSMIEEPGRLIVNVPSWTCHTHLCIEGCYAELRRSTA